MSVTRFLSNVILSAVVTLADFVLLWAMASTLYVPAGKEMLTVPKSESSLVWCTALSFVPSFALNTAKVRREHTSSTGRAARDECWEENDVWVNGDTWRVTLQEFVVLVDGSESSSHDSRSQDDMKSEAATNAIVLKVLAMVVCLLCVVIMMVYAYTFLLPSGIDAIKIT